MDSQALLVIGNIIVFGAICTLPRSGWSKTKILATLALLALGELTLGLVTDPGPLAMGITALNGSLLLLIEMTLASRMVIGIAWLVCGIVMVVATSNIDTVAPWLVAQRTWIVSAGLIAAIAVGAMAVRSARLARDAYSESEGYGGPGGL